MTTNNKMVMTYETKCKQFDIDKGTTINCMLFRMELQNIYFYYIYPLFNKVL